MIQTSSTEQTTHARENNFDLVRHVAAWLVIAGHAHILLGLHPPTLMGISLHTIGVEIFFVMSGYLITQSWLADPQVPRYLARRALRLFPALTACVLICAFAMGPWLTNLCLECYFEHERLWRYLYNIALNVQYTLPGVFEGQGSGPAVNGSLWTLPVEAFAYLLLPLLVIVFTRVSKVVFVLILLAIAGWDIWMQVYPPPEPRVIYGTLVTAAMKLMTFFMLGAAVKLFSLERKLDMLVGILLAILLSAFPLLLPLEIGFAAVVVAWLGLAIGLAPRGPLQVPRWCGDISYGMYLWAFPVQQLLIHLGLSPHHVWWHIAATTVISGALALLSWHAVEKHALRFKPRRRAPT